MRSSLLRVLLIIVLGVVLLASPQAEGREILDWLPEVQFAKSMHYFQSDLVRGQSFSGERCIASFATNIIPDHLLYDENGIFRNREGIRQVNEDVLCMTIISAVSGFTPVQILMGERVVVELSELLEGRYVVDGSKQSVRVGFALSGYLFLLHELLFVPLHRISGESLLGEDPCETLVDWVLNGNTIELRYSAFQTLRLDQQLVENPDFDAKCTQPRTKPVNELIIIAREGDLEASLALSSFWNAEVNSLFSEVNEDEEVVVREDASLEEIQARIQEFELLILENTERFPLLTMAAIATLISLYGFEESLILTGSEGEL